MRLQKLGSEIRKKRRAVGLTQAQLANSAGVSRTTLNQFERGLVPDLGVRKVLSLLEQLGLTLAVHPANKDQRDFVRMACTTANVSFRTSLTEDELIRALLTGKVPAQREPHLRTLIDEAPPTLLNGLVREVSRWSTPEQTKANFARIAAKVGANRSLDLD